MDEHAPKEKTILRITDIEFANSQLDDKIVGVFRFEPGGGKKGPTLLAIAEVDGVGYVYDQLLDTVNNEAEHSRNLLSAVDHDPVTRFEKIIKNINEAVADFAAKEQTPVNWNRVNIFLLEISESHLCLAGVGRLMNMFLQKQKDGSYKTYDLFGSLDQPAEVDEKKSFSNIICGDFKPGDVLIAGSKNFENIRNELRLKERLTTMPPVSAALEIKADLEARGIPDDFVATVVASLPVTDAQPALTKAEDKGSTASVMKLRETERETTRQLGPSIAPQNADTSKGEPRAPFIAGTLGVLARAKGLFRRERVRDVATKVSLRGMNDGFGTFLSKKKKSFIIGGIILVVLIVVIGSTIKHQQTLAAERAAWNSSYDNIKSTIERAEGEAVYSEDRARRSLGEAAEKLASLDESTSLRQEALAGLRKQADDLREKLRRAVNVNDPKSVYALPSDIAEGALASPIIVGENLVFADRSSKSLVVINITTGDTKTIRLPDDAGRVVAIGEGKNSVVAVTEDRAAYAATLSSGDVAAIALGDAEAKGVSDMVLYANRVYILDAGSEQIWRHPTAGSGFGVGQKYLQASAAKLNDAASLAIDSNVYVLKADGTVARYFGGGQDGFSLSPIDPSLASADQLWVHPDNPYIAIADSKGNRVVLFTKEGSLVAQYASPAWKGPTDVTADPVSKKLFVVDSNKVYELLLP